MIQLKIEQTANQSFQFQSGQNLYDIEIRTTAKATFFSISRNSTVLISNEILISNTILIQSRYQATDCNFIFYSLVEEIPNYRLFGVTQFIYFATLDELQNG